MADRDSAFSASSLELMDAAVAAGEPSFPLAPPMTAAQLPVVSQPRADARLRRGVWAARQTVAAYADLPDDWDKRGGHRPADEDIANALAVLDAIEDAAVAEPRPGAVGDGEIVLRWRLPNDGYLCISFEEGWLVYIACSPAGDESEGECEFSDEKARLSLLCDIKRFIAAHVGGARQ